MKKLKTTKTENLNDQVKILDALANETRLKIFLELCTQKKMNVSSIQAQCGVKQASVSQALKKLANAGLVTSERSGVAVYYSINDKFAGNLQSCIEKL